MKLANSAASIAAILCTVTLGSASQADESRSVAFASNIWPNVNFLDKSSRLAISHSSNWRLRKLARVEAGDQTIAANTLVAWLDSVTSQPKAGTATRPAHGSVLSVPFRTAAELSTGVADGIDGMQSGRSVAIDEPAAPSPRVVTLKDIDLSSANANIERLSDLSGRRFDSLFEASQIDALTQLSTVYATYIKDGDDPGLRNFATRQLPKIDNALATLRSLK